MTFLLHFDDYLKKCYQNVKNMTFIIS